ncbi:MAG: hypothetical protein H6707_16540 [Deltaproteobacteria bacterium]|nr:hypothetical protein [Deltaproteobacteria bacterium]
MQKLAMVCCAVLASTVGCGGDDTRTTPRYSCLESSLTLRYELVPELLPAAEQQLLKKSGYAGTLDVSMHSRWPPWSHSSARARLAGTTNPVTVSLARPIEFFFPDVQNFLGFAAQEPGDPDRLWVVAAFGPRASVNQGFAGAVQSMGARPDETATRGLCRRGCRYDDQGNCPADGACDALLDDACTATCENDPVTQGVPIIAVGHCPKVIPPLTIRLNGTIFESLPADEQGNN